MPLIKLRPVVAENLPTSPWMAGPSTIPLDPQVTSGGYTWGAASVISGYVTEWIYNHSYYRGCRYIIYNFINK